MNSRGLTMALAVLLAAPAARAESLVIDFEDITLPASGFLNDSGPAGHFSSNGASFENSITDFGSFTVWSGWSISNRGTSGVPQNPPTTGLGQLDFQYHGAAGGGRGGSGNFGVAFIDTQVDPAPVPNISAVVDLPTVASPVGSMSAWFSLTTYTLLSIELGNEFAAPFGSTDFLTLTIVGFSEQGAGGTVSGSVDVDLAGGGSTATSWTEVDLSGLFGSRSLGFRMSSSQTTEFGGITFLSVPAYFAMDDLTIAPLGVVPEPASLAMLGLGIVSLAAFASRRRRAG